MAKQTEATARARAVDTARRARETRLMTRFATGFLVLALSASGTAAERATKNEAGPATQSQIAATLAAALGEDWCAAEPRAARPIAGLVR